MEFTNKQAPRGRKGEWQMAYGDQSEVRDNNGNVTHVDIDRGGETWRYETWDGTDTPRELVSVQDHDTGRSQEASGTDFFGNPVYK
jgi:hypothetical protein